MAPVKLLPFYAFCLSGYQGVSQPTLLGMKIFPALLAKKSFQQLLHRETGCGQCSELEPCPAQLTQGRVPLTVDKEEVIVCMSPIVSLSPALLQFGRDRQKGSTMDLNGVFLNKTMNKAKQLKGNMTVTNMQQIIHVFYSRLYELSY